MNWDWTYTLQLAGGSFGKLDTEAYGRINPNRMIPSIRDGGFALWESLTIVRYLCDRYGAGTLSPSFFEILDLIC